MDRRRQRLAELRKAAGHTQDSLARELQVDVTTVRRWENGSTEAPQPWRRARLAALLEITIAELNDVLIDNGGSEFRDQIVISGSLESPELHVSSVDEASSGECKGALIMAEERARRFTQAFGTGGISDESLEQVYDDVAQLASSYQRQPLTHILGQLTNTQESVFTLLDQRQRPAQARHLFFLGGIVSGVLAKACHDFMNPSSAMVHARTAFLCADQADHNGLRAWTRGLQSQIAYWAGRHRDALRYAQQGAAFAATAEGSTAVWLPASEARAWAALGNATEAVAAIRRAENALESDHADELDDLGGLCKFGPSRQLYYAADALAWLTSEAPRAESYADRAVEAYANTDDPDWAFGDQAGSRSNLAIARANRGERDGASDALRPVLDLPPEMRINGVIGSAQRVYDALRRSEIAESSATLQDEIESFTSTPLRALPPGAG